MLVGQALVRDGLIGVETVERILAEQKKTKRRVCSLAVHLGLITEAEALRCLKGLLGYPTVTAWELLQANELVSGELLTLSKQHKVVPFRRFHRSVFVAMADPNDGVLVSRLENHFGAIIRPVLALELALETVLQQWYSEVNFTPETDEHQGPAVQRLIHEDTPSQSPLSKDDIIAVQQARQTLRDGLMSLSRGASDDALRALKKSVFLDPFHDRAQYYLGRAYVEANDLDSARLAFERAVALNGHDFGAHFALARCYEALDRHSDALSTWRAAVSLAPDTNRRAHVESIIDSLARMTHH